MDTNNSELKARPAKRNRFFKIIALSILTIFLAHIYIIPSAYSITVEEQARRGDKRRPQVEDDFSRKAQSRRGQGAANVKDPRLACLLSLIVPGSGEIYLKNDIKGIGFFLLAIGGYSFGGYYFYETFKDKDISGTEQKSKYVISGLLIMVAIIVHVVGIVEAYNDAIEINEKSFYYGKKRSKSPYIARLVVP